MIRIRKFRPEDTDCLAAVMKRAFDRDSQMHLGTDGGPDGYDNGDFIRKWFMHGRATSLTVQDGDRIIGGVNLLINADHVNFLECLFLDPEYEDRGIGTKLWHDIEEMFPDTVEWHTETPIFSHRNHNFYVNKCEFAIVKIENPKDPEEGSYLMRKVMQKRG